VQHTCQRVDDPRTIQAAHAGQSDYQKHSSKAAFEKSQHPLIDDVARVGEHHWFGAKDHFFSFFLL